MLFRSLPITLLLNQSLIILLNKNFISSFGSCTLYIPSDISTVSITFKYPVPSNSPHILSSFCSIPCITVSKFIFTSTASSFNSLSIFSFTVSEFFSITFIKSFELVFTQYGINFLLDK